MIEDTAQLVRNTRRFAAEHRGRSWWVLLSTLALFVGAIGVVCMDLHWGVRVLASLLAALLHVRVFVIYHDYLHGAILQGSRVADCIFKLYGLLSLSPASIWKHTHDHHHRNNARRLGVDSVGTYPVMTIDAYHEAEPRVRFYYALARHPLTILFGYLTVFLWGFCIQPLFADRKRHRDAIAAIVVHFGLLTVLAIFRPDIMLLGLVIPTFIASALGAYLFYAQHNYPGAKLRPGENWDYTFAALHSSSFMRLSPVMHWFTGNIGYHHVHHLNARIPFYRLPEAMKAIEELQSPGTTSLWPTDIVRCFRMNLWDPAKDRLVSYAEAERSHRLAAVS